MMRCTGVIGGVLAVCLLVGIPAWGEAVTAVPPTTEALPGAAEVTEAPAGTAEAAVWDSVHISDDAERNQKLDRYRKRPLGQKVLGDGPLVAYYPKAFPAGVTEALQYTRYPAPLQYLTHLGGGGVSVKAAPSFDAKTIRKLGRYQHIATDGIVQGAFSQAGNTDRWYRVYWGEGADRRQGYVYAPWIVKRGFQMEKMVRAINRLREEVNAGEMAHIDNYKNRNGWAPKRGGADADAYGALRDQSAAAYFQQGEGSDFRYMTDGTLVRILGEKDGRLEVVAPNYEGVYYVDPKYVKRDLQLSQLKKVVVVDRNHQNEAVFEADGEGWKLISYLMATTGEKAKFKQETSLGTFMVMEKKSKFLYLGDVSKKIEGYAPYALRFNGGAYIHGVPVNFKEVRRRVTVREAVLDPAGNVVTPAVTKDVVVEQKDPGIQEYLSSIGTTPRSHKCVRNYTSHAQFLYDWAEVGKTAVIVIE